MTYDNLGDFLAELQDDGELVRVTAPVEAAFEIAEITGRVCQSKDGGPALLFENVAGGTVPVVTNLLGSRRRICKALRCRSLDETAQRIVALIHPDVPESWLETLRLVPQFAQLARLPPKIVKTGLCQQVVKLGRDVDLGSLPIPHSWPGERAPTITFGQVFTKDAETGVRNVGLYPLGVRDGQSLSVHWNVHHDGRRHFEQYRRLGRQMPVAVVLGGDPATVYAASAPLPSHTDQCLFAGFLRDKPVELVKCRNIEMEVPAQAELVIEGYIDPQAEWEPAGPIACPTGFYSLEEPAPVLHVTGLTHRSNPVFPALIYGRPPMEDSWLGKASERIFLPLVRLFSPEIVDYHLPRWGAFRNCVFVSIHKHYPQQARKVMHALWSFGRLTVAKMIVVVDAEVDVHDEEQVWFTVGANVHPGRDVVFCEGPGDMLDHAAPVQGLGHKMGLDATRKLPEEGHPRPWPEELRPTTNIQALVNQRWEEYGLPNLAPLNGEPERMEQRPVEGKVTSNE